MTVKTFLTVPHEVKALVWTGSNFKDLDSFPTRPYTTRTLEAGTISVLGEWGSVPCPAGHIIVYDGGEFSVWRPTHFADNFTPTTQESSK